MFDRIAILNSADATIAEPGTGHIAHGVFHALMREFLRGAIPASRLEQYFTIAGSNVDWTYLKARYAAVTNKAEFVEVLWDCMQLAEVRCPGYQTVAELKARIQAAV